MIFEFLKGKYFFFDRVSILNFSSDEIDRFSIMYRKAVNESVALGVVDQPPLLLKSILVYLIFRKQAVKYVGLRAEAQASKDQRCRAFTQPEPPHDRNLYCEFELSPTEHEASKQQGRMIVMLPNLRGKFF